MPDRPRLLILGGTAEAVALAGRAAADFEATYSLAGRTRAPVLPDAVAVRSGGFGGAEALAAWISGNGVAAVVDATHPFAAGIAGNARRACAVAGVPHLKLLRPPWTATDGDDWHQAADVAAAATLLPQFGGCAFLALGRQELAAFSGIAGMRFVVRSVDPPDGDTALPRASHLTGRGPFTVDAETALLRDHRIDVVVSRNAGGDSTHAKIAAARALGLPVVMIARPPPPPGACVATVDDALAWLAGLMP